MGRGPNPLKPSFIRILYQQFSKKLEIPLEFVKRHRDTLPRKCILRRASSRKLTWRVRTKEIDNKLFFKKGWTAFFEDNSLRVGDFLRFENVRDSVFDVDIYDMSCCHKKIAVSPLSSDTALINAPTPRQEKNNVRTRAFMEGKELMSRSRFPTFEIIMRPAYVKNGYLHIPSKFAKEHMQNARYVTLQVSDQTWRSKLMPGTSTRITQGWSECVQRNSIKEGDACVFELVGKKKVTLKVSIFRNIKVEEENRTHLVSPRQSSRTKVELKEKSARKALAEAEKFLSTSKHLSFLIVIRKSYLENNYLHVPPTFVKNWHMQGKYKAKLQLSGKTWGVTLSIYNNYSRIVKGWPAFAKEISIEVGDVCVLELLNREDFVFKVSVFRKL